MLDTAQFEKVSGMTQFTHFNFGYNKASKELKDFACVGLGLNWLQACLKSLQQHSPLDSSLCDGSRSTTLNKAIPPLTRFNHFSTNKKTSQGKAASCNLRS